MKKIEKKYKKNWKIMKKRRTKNDFTKLYKNLRF